MTGIVFDINAINAFMGTGQWHFAMNPDGLLQLLVRRGNVCEVVNAAKFLKDSEVFNRKSA